MMTKNINTPNVCCLYDNICFGAMAKQTLKISVYFSVNLNWLRDDT